MFIPSWLWRSSTFSDKEFDFSINVDFSLSNKLSWKEENIEYNIDMGQTILTSQYGPAEEQLSMTDADGKRYSEVPKKRLLICTCFKANLGWSMGV